MRFEKGVAPELEPPELIRDDPRLVALWRHCKRHDIPIHVAEIDREDFEALKKINSENDETE